MAIDAIDRSGLTKELRQGLATELQEAFIKLAKAQEEERGHVEEEEKKKEEEETDLLPPWAKIAEPHRWLLGASAAVRVEYHPDFGRHVLAGRNVVAGEVLFVERPLVSYLDPEEAATTTEFCHECFSKVSVPVPCPTCSRVVFCSRRCRGRALSSHHQVECRTHHVFRGVGLDDKCLVMLAFRAVAQRPHAFFAENAERLFGGHDVQRGAGDNEEEEGVLDVDDAGYRALFCLVTHESSRQDMDVATKTVFAVFLLECLKVAGYFGDISDEDSVEVAAVVVGRLLLHFLMAFQFNTHMVEGVYDNRLICSHDAETRIWKEAKK